MFHSSTSGVRRPRAKNGPVAGRALGRILRSDVRAPFAGTPMLEGGVPRRARQPRRVGQQVDDFLAAVIGATGAAQFMPPNEVLGKLLAVGLKAGADVP